MPEQTLPDTEINPTLKEYLAIWTRWIRRPGIDLGFPHASPGFAPRGLADHEDLEDEADNYAAVVMDKLIDGLGVLERAAVHHHQLHAVFRARDLQGAWASALEKLERGIRAEGWL